MGSFVRQVSVCIQLDTCFGSVKERVIFGKKHAFVYISNVPEPTENSLVIKFLVLGEGKAAMEISRQS